jgi:radical SAM superfamily enzyme YgiQ (UPF0313 family)
VKILLVSVSIEFPLASYCLAAQILASSRMKGCSVELLHLDWKRLASYERKNAEIWRYIAKIEQLRPDVIGFSVYLWNHLATREIVAITHLLFPSVRVVIGGPEVATPEAASAWLQVKGVNVVVRGEGEQTFEDVIERLAQGDPTRGVAGTSRNDSGLVTHEPPRPPIKALDELASPFLIDGLITSDLFDREVTPPGSAPYSRVLLETYRGCYMECSYCQWGNGTKARFPFPQDRLRAEISLLLQAGVREIFFVDAMFGHKKATAMSLLEYIVQEKRRLDAKTRFSLYHNQDFCDPCLFDLYREAEAYIEVDLQSTNYDVLQRLGRARWTVESFERHLKAIREQHIPTTGAADLIIGIPGDNLESFEESVDYLLRKDLRVNLYQASILPDTAWSRSLEEDGTVYSPVAPRAILKNNTFSLKDMVTARLIGHGTDLFNSFPRLAGIMWRRWFKRPVDLCRMVGESLFERGGVMYGESHQYEWVLGNLLESLENIIRDLCPDPDTAEVLVELLKFEGTLASLTWRPGNHRIAPESDWRIQGEDWLRERPKAREEGVHRIAFRYPIYQLVLDWDRDPDPARLESITERPNAVLFYNNGRAQYLPIDLGVTDRLVRRFSGYFSVKEALDNIHVRFEDMSPVWNMLALLAETGLIVRGRPDVDADRWAHYKVRGSQNVAADTMQLRAG